MPRPELALWLMLAVMLWILADVAPGYHTANAKGAHDLYTNVGLGVLLGAVAVYAWTNS